MQNEQTDKKQYEISFLLKEEAGQKLVLDTIKELGGDIETESPVSKIALAYPIKKETSAFFGFLHFFLAPAEIKELNHRMETTEAILRHLIITPPFKKAPPRERPQSAPASKEEAPRASAVSKKAESPKNEVLTNEDLEKRIEEILK